jgi:hypothetical protein
VLEWSLEQLKGQLMVSQLDDKLERRLESVLGERWGRSMGLWKE